MCTLSVSAYVQVHCVSDVLSETAATQNGRSMESSSPAHQPQESPGLTHQSSRLTQKDFLAVTGKGEGPQFRVAMVRGCGHSCTILVLRPQEVELLISCWLSCRTPLQPVRGSVEAPTMWRQAWQWALGRGTSVCLM